jgi:hypothetical protein
MTSPSFISNKQGNQMILLGSNCFTKHCTRKNGAVYWKCYFSRKKDDENTKWDCKATLTTSAMNLDIVDHNSEHVDHPEFTKLDARIHECLDSVTKRSRNEYGSIGNIYRDEINKLIEEDFDIDELAAKMPKFDSRKARFYNERNQDIPKTPNTLASIDLTSPRYNQTKYKKRFLLFDTKDNDRIIAFASDIQQHQRILEHEIHTIF